jgi:putative transposase
MSRPLRIEFAGAFYHVTSRGNGRKPIFRDDQDRRAFLEVLHKVNQRHHWLCHAYCLMNNHYHLVIETPEGNLSRGMRQLNGVYTMYFNRRHRTVGHVFQGRYKAILVERESYLLEVCRYVVLNPVRSGTVKGPGDWRWSSYRGTAGLDKPRAVLTTDWILGQMGRRKGEAIRRYRAFVRDGIGGGAIWKEVKGQSILGEDDFIDEFIDHVRGYKEIKEIPRGQRYLGRPGLEDLFPEKIVRDREIRNEVIGKAVGEWGYSQREVADYLKLHYSTLSRIMKWTETSRSKT